MSKIPITIVENHGGKSTDLKQGPAHSFAYSRHVDFRKNPTGLSLLPKTRLEYTTGGLSMNMIQLPTGVIWCLGDNGDLYIRAVDGTWTVVSVPGAANFTPAVGMYYSRVQDRIYIADRDGLFVVVNPGAFFSGGSITVAKALLQTLDQSATDHTNTYTSLAAISDTLSTDKLSFVPTVEPLESIKLWVTAKGTGDVIVTLHDAQNNNLGQVTKTAASLTNGQLNQWVFTTPVRNTVKPNASTYHVHVTHTGGTASTIGCSIAADLSTAQYETWVNLFLRTNNGWHPFTTFLNKMVGGNGRYVFVWEIVSQPLSGLSAVAGTGVPTNNEVLRHRVVLEPDYEVTSFAVVGEYLAIGAEKRSTVAGNEYQEGKIYFWDGYSAGWNTATDIPNGAPYSLFSNGNIVYYFAGGGWWATTIGGKPVKLQQMPYTDTEFTDNNTYMVNNPYMMTIRNDILLGAFPSLTNSTTIEHGIYSFGARDKNYDPSFGYSYTMSTGTRTNGTLQIGMVKSFGPKLYMAWKDGTTYGIDVVDANSDPFPTGTWESLVMDLGRPDKQKEAVKLIIDFEALLAGATVTPKYKINRAASWTNSTPAKVGVEGQTSVELSINKRFKEIQIAIDFTATTTTPQIIATTLIVETLGSEQD